MPETLQSRPYLPSTAMCCGACVFGGGEHEVWCRAIYVTLSDEQLEEARNIRDACLLRGIVVRVVR
jgi:hypothetical protein